MVPDALTDQTGKAVGFTMRQPASPLVVGSQLYMLGVNDKGDQSIYALDLDGRQVRSLDIGTVPLTGGPAGGAGGRANGFPQGGATASPQGGGQRGGSADFVAQFRRTLLASNDGKTLYLIDNAPNGSVMDIDATTLKIRRSEDFVVPDVAPVATPTPGLGSNGTPEPTPYIRLGVSGFGARGRLVLRTPALSPDGARLWLPTASGLVDIHTSDLQVHGMYLPGVGLESVALSPDGLRLYALSAEQSKIIRLDAATGAIQGQVDYTEQPYAVLHVLTNK
jgi:hypothetical protein